MELEQFIKQVLLDNAIKYEGETTPKAALGAVMREYPEYRGKTQEILALTKPLVEEINALSVEEQKQLLSTLGGSGAPEKEEKNQWELEGENLVLRFEPSPSGPMHIGHAYSLGVNHLLAARNDAKLILRIADTNPDNIYEPAYKLLEEDANWYTHQNIAEVIIQSDRLELYYTYAEQLLQRGHAYICTCEAEKSREHLKEQQACECRELSVGENIQRWELMKTTWEPGDAVMRLKTDLTHKNPAMRDFPLMRIHHGNHPRAGTKYAVWPLMNFSVFVDDVESNMTHILRAKDHADNAKRQEYLYKYFNKPIPETFFVGKINFTDLKLSTSQTRKLIDEGVYTGWDDIRLPFLPALRRRGYQAEAFLRLADEVGITQTDKTLSKEEYFKTINAYNKELIDAQANRAFLIQTPVLITIQGAPTITVQKAKHPDKKVGTRELVVGEDVYVDEEDLKEPQGVIFRLIDAYNFQYINGSFVYLDSDVETYKQAPKKRILHYVPAQEALEATLLTPDGRVHAAKAEKSVAEYEQDTIVQFERVGYARLDDKKTFTFWYTHP
ncbi:MAG: glutamate--tRNA ligase [Candidatus Woesearchaeota archaeon]